MGSGFVPGDLIGARMGRMASILATCPAYEAFVGEDVAELGASGMYFDGLDRRDLMEAEEEVFPAAFVIWANGDDVKFFSTQGGGASFKWQGSVTMTVEGDTPEIYARNTPGAYNWIRGHVSAMLLEMKAQFGVGPDSIQDVESFFVLDGPYRSPESDDRDYCSMTIGFELRT